MTDRSSTVAAVVATYNRSEILARTLQAIGAQERLPDRVFVVDNGSPDETVSMLRRAFPDTTCIELGDNRGAGAGLAAGMSAALDDGADLLWLLDDDTQPAPATLRVLLDSLDRTAEHDTGIVALSGGMFRHGVIHHLPTSDLPLLDARDPGVAGLHRAEFVVYDGGLVTRRAVECVGLPRDDYFLVFDDLEYAMRVHEAGMTLAVVDATLIDRMHLGSGGGGEASPPWRGYYQTRNHLRAALDRRSPLLLWGWLVRNAKLVVATALRGDRKEERLRLRARAVADALRNRMGRRVEPRG